MAKQYLPNLWYNFSDDDSLTLNYLKTLGNKRHSIHTTENITVPDIEEVRNQPFYLGERARKFIKPLKEHMYLHKIMPYNWNSIFKEDDVPRKKLSAEFLDNPQGFLKDLCGEDKVKTLLSDPIIDLEQVKILEDEDVSLFDEIFLELSNNLPISSTCDKTRAQNLSDVDMLDSEVDSERQMIARY